MLLKGLHAVQTDLFGAGIAGLAMVREIPHHVM